jgi:hypothetical protein
VIGHLRPVLGEATLRPADRDQLRVLVHVRGILAAPEPGDLKRLPCQPLRVLEPAVELGADDAQADHVPAVERLADPLGELGHRDDLRVEPWAVAELQEAADPRVAREERQLLIAQVGGQSEDLLRVRDPVADQLGSAERPMPRVEGDRERLGVVEPPGHLDRLGAQAEPALVLGRRGDLDREARQHLRPERAVLLGQRRERVLKQAERRGADLEAREQERAAEPDDVAERRAREPLAVAEAARQVGGLLEARPRRPAVAGAPARVAEPEQHVGATLERHLTSRAEQPQGTLVVPARLLVGEQGRGPVPRANEVVDRRRDVAERRGQREVVGDLREVRIEVVAVEVLEDGADPAVEVEALGGREVLVERLADQLVDEPVLTWDGGVLRDDARVAGLVEHLEQPGDLEPARPLEHAQVEVAADDGGQAERLDGVRAEVGHAPAQEGADLLRDPRVAVPEPVWADQANDLAEEERIAAGERVQALGEGAVRPSAGHSGQVRLDLVDVEAAKRDPGGLADQLGERLRALVQLGLALAVGADEHDGRPRRRLAHEPQHHERGGVGGVDVVEDDEQGAAGGGLDEELRDGVEQPEAGGLGVDGLAGPSREALGVAAERTNRLDPGPVGRRTAALPAAPGGHPQPPVARLADELLQEPRLPDTRLAAQEHERAAPLSRLIEGRTKLVELARATDERAAASS